eukprot:scaffold274017_cov21-Prasinocladus_malaysianus.AAC.1
MSKRLHNFRATHQYLNEFFLKKLVIDGHHAGEQVLAGVLQAGLRGAVRPAVRQGPADVGVESDLPAAAAGATSHAQP